jgi:L-alanine-DL-glutamate epimerase-like enolase superfamily enzyme
VPFTITSVEAIPVALPLTKPISSALGLYETMPGAVVSVKTSEGVEGFGFNLGLGGAAGRSVSVYIDDELAPLAVGQDALAPEAVWQRMWAPNKARMRGGIGVWALSAVDIAVWDIVAKTAGLPLHTILGGYRRHVPVYGSGGWLSLSDAELVAEAQAMAALGIPSYKYKIGSSRDEERTALLRREMGEGFLLLADGNQGFNVRRAIETSAMLASYGVGWFEEPVVADSIDDLADVAAGSQVPIATGENEFFRWGFREICERRAAAYLQPDITRCGGVTEFRRIAALADSFGLSLTSHLWHELSISLVGAAPSGWAVEYTNLIDPAMWTNPFPVVDGAIEVPQVPGHGAYLVPEAIERFRI